MKASDIIQLLESFAPLSHQESWDNSGLIVGRKDQMVKGVLVSTDVTRDVLQEAFRRGLDMIVSHHPLIFNGLKRISGENATERLVMEAIRHDLVIYAVHTNADRAEGGVSSRMARKLGLIKQRVLVPYRDELKKLVFFVPVRNAGEVREQIFSAGAGKIGEYDQCSFSVEGTGTFRGSPASDPFRGRKGKLHSEKELRVETVFPAFKKQDILKALLASHPYEEVAYDIYSLDNVDEKRGMGISGEFQDSLDEKDFLSLLGRTFKAEVIRHTDLSGCSIKKVALCGGSGSSLLHQAIRQGADAFVTADFKYHQFFDADGKTLIADIGHYESEQYTVEIFHELIRKKFPKFAVRLSEVNTNPVKYYTHG